VSPRPLKEDLNKLYKKYNNKKFIEFDPIKYVYMFDSKKEQELVGLISSSFAFGRVKQIFKAMDKFLDICDHKPLEYTLTLKNRPEKELRNFKYRFVTGDDLFKFLKVTQKILNKHGSIGSFLKKTCINNDLLTATDLLLKEYKNVNYLIPNSLSTSACKRLFMYYRWMVRKDNIDLGLWTFIKPSELVIPLDTHISQKSKELGLTERKSPSLKTALDITNSLKKYSKNDPVKYDWALSHIGIIKNNFS
jgi:uncharacterized protein (TIGR02757 family)